MAAISSKGPENSIAYINGRVYTINKNQPWAEAFIVAPDGTFTAVGRNEEILVKAKNDKLVTYDLHDKFVMPGLHDAHVHVLHAGLAHLSNAELGMDATIDNIVERMKKGSCACAYAHAYGDWLVGDTFWIENFDRKCLDEAFPDTPVMIRAGAGHSMFLNTAALKRSGYDVDQEKEERGSVLRRREDGSLTGEVAEIGMTKAALAYSKPGLAHAKRVMKHAMNILHRSGVTSFQEASANTIILHGLRELEADGELNMDVQTHLVYAPEQLGEESKESLLALLDSAEKFRSQHVDTRFVKIMMDGVPFPPNFSQCGLDEHGNVDDSKILVDDIAQAIEKYDARGMTCKVHCTGQGSTRRTLDAIELTRKKNPNGPRHEVAHCNGVHNDDFARFAKLNVTAEMSPAMFFSHPLTATSNGLMDWNFSKMIETNAHVTIGSDWVAPSNPSLFPALGGIVEKVGGGSNEKGAETLCRMLTLAGAEAVGRDKVTGSIETGKKANFITLDKDVSGGDFDGVSVLTTWFEGKIVWEKPE